MSSTSYTTKAGNSLDINELLLQVVHRQEVRLRVQGQEQDQRARERRQVRHEGHLGEGQQLQIGIFFSFKNIFSGYADPRQRWLRARQVCPQPAAPGHGTEDQDHDVPQQNLDDVMDCAEKYL